MESITWTSRLGALALAGATLWALSVTAGSGSPKGAVQALERELPLALLRWELGDLAGGDDLSVPTVLTLGESPLLLSARQAVAELRSRRDTVEEPDAPQDPAQDTEPVQETPVKVEPAADNGVPARTLVPTTTEGYTVAGLAYIHSTRSDTLSAAEAAKPFSARLSGEAGPQVLILHSHGSECYTPAPGADILYSGNHRSTDSRYNVVLAGDAMAEELEMAGIPVLHDRTLYDYPSYSGAYDRSLAAIETALAEYPSIHFILDVHRDAIEDAEGNEYKVISETGQGSAAQLALVVGSDGSGLPHPNWMENLRLAVALQNQIAGEEPTLMRPILLRKSRYNQHAATGSLLVEVGAAGNAPEEAELAARLFARQLAELLQGAGK